MTQKEFFDRTGIELTEDQYKQVEQMYLEAGNMDKDEFCKDYKKHHESTLLATYFRQAENLKDKLDALEKAAQDMAQAMYQNQSAGPQQGFGGQANSNGGSTNNDDDIIDAEFSDKN